jgi:glycosyltransferase involved in cell wall biosynthesis
MKVLFDAYWWHRGPVSNRQVLRETINAWRSAFPHDEIILAVRRRDRGRVTAETGLSNHHNLRLWPHGLSILFELPLILAHVRPDITLTQNFTPLVGRASVFMQDVLFVTNPEWFTRLERIYYRLMTLTAPHAQMIFTSSVSEERRIRSVVGSRRPIHAVGIAVSPRLLEASPITPDPALRRGGFLLTVGRLNVRKNVELTAKAALASGILTREFPLVIAGSVQGKAVGLSPEVSSAVEEGLIRLLGHVSDSELTWLYSNTSCFVFMTHAEGFGLPPLEAMAFGAPVIASDIPVMHEVLGHHATFSPLDESALARLLEKVAGGRLDADESALTHARSRYTYGNTVRAIRAALESGQSGAMRS